MKDPKLILILCLKTMTSNASSVSLQEEADVPEASPTRSTADDLASIQQRLIAAMEEAAWTFLGFESESKSEMNLRLIAFDTR